MVRKLLAVLFLNIPVLIFGQTLDDFNTTVDFSITLSELDQVALSGDPDALPSRFVIVDGAVASREVINSGADEFLGEIGLVGGEWMGVEKVVRFECVLQLIGPEFANAIPARRSRNPNPAEITLNSRILVVARALGLRAKDDGTFIPVLHAVAIRKIQ